MKAQDPEGNPKVIRYAGYGLGLIGLALLIFGFYFIKTAIESFNWPEAKATVESTVVKWSYVDGGRGGVRSESDKQYYYEVTYKYDVNNVPYTSGRYSLGSGYTASSMFNERKDADIERKELYPNGKEIIIYYDPNAPYSAVISKGTQWSTYVPLILGIFFAGTAFLLIKSAKFIEARDAKEKGLSEKA
ncbi:MAG: DUF3592 domain-containing protein [Bdellovibrionales bacterium]|nr:DUF3592 domain-containing protein [Bdellovibrionales bacterium]